MPYTQLNIQMNIHLNMDLHIKERWLCDPLGAMQLPQRILEAVVWPYVG